ncbi:TRAM/LAG1/CLN8 homology domain [Ostreococcus tauri]|nr:TRAM/LAG1/CLN8 homology domain [Ostreococcus tauri]CEG01484.1 TRAM/LAG1/CLN8 homology domain [Ostreococcus tauri]|eukprot:XP_003080787.2 TRAM/LAG1/CLN8 homology domain [Ostreococcus tauri]
MTDAPSLAHSLGRVALGVFIWEAMFRGAKKAFADGLPERDAKERAYKKALASYAVSFVHAIFLAWAGWVIVFKLRNASEAERLSLYANDDERFVGFVEVVTIAFFSYVLYDLFHVVEQYPNLGGVDMLAHHAAFATASFLAYAYGAYPYMLGWLCTCETSTPILNVRFFVKSWREMDYTLPYISYIAEKLGMKTRGAVAGNWLEYYVSVAFFCVFVAVRLVGYGGAFIALNFDLRSTEDNFLPYSVRATLYTLVLMGLLLNVVWSYKINGMVRHFRRKVLKQRDEGEAPISDSEEDPGATQKLS